MSNFSNFSNQYRYKLEKGSKKHYCPECGKKRFVRFVDIETGEYLPEQYGRCDKGDGHYFVNPYSDGYAKVIREQERGNFSELPKNWKSRPKKIIPQPEPEPFFFDFETFKKTLQPERYEYNTFIQNLFYRVLYPFDINDVTNVIQLYRLGTIANGYCKGAVTFPFIDIKGNIRAVQVKQFNEQNHTTGTDFLHSIIEKDCTRNNKPLPEWLGNYIKQDKRITCLFGEHILNKYPNAYIFLFEAPKTAIYFTLYFGFPELSNIICLAVYNKSSFSFDKLKVLQGRFVYVFPDLSKDGNTFKEWETKAKEYESRLSKTRFYFSDLLERLAPEGDKNEGYDIADYLIKQNWKEYRNGNIQKTSTQPEPKKVTKVTEVTVEKNILYTHIPTIKKVEELKTEKIEKWNKDISELENYFSNITLPEQPIKLNHYTTITDCRKFIQNSLTALKSKNGMQKFDFIFIELNELKKIISL